MAQLEVNQFTSYALTQDEQLASQCFTTTQKQGLQNLRLALTTSLLAVKPDMTKDNWQMLYFQQEAYYRGQLDIINHILDLSEAAEEAAQQSQ